MSKGRILKIVEKMLRCPPEMRVDEVKKVLEFFGWQQRNRKGSHIIYCKGLEELVIVERKGRFIKRIYIKRVIDMLSLEEWYEENKKW